MLNATCCADLARSARVLGSVVNISGVEPTRKKYPDSVYLVVRPVRMLVNV